MAKPTRAKPPVLLTGTGALDNTEISQIIKNTLAGELLDPLFLPVNFSGDIVFDVRMRFSGGVLKTVDHSLQKRRRRLYSEE